MKFYATPARMLFILDANTNKFKPVAYNELHKLPQGQICYMAEYKRLGEDDWELSLSLGEFDTFVIATLKDADVLRPKFLLSFGLSADSNRYIFSSCQKYNESLKTKGKWYASEKVRLVSLSGQYQSNGQYNIGSYGGVEKDRPKNTSDFPLINLPADNLFEDLLKCIQTTRENIEIATFLRVDSDFPHSDDKQKRVVFNVFCDTKSSALRTRMFNIIELDQGPINYKAKQGLQALATDLTKWQRQVSDENNAAIGMRVLSGFIGALGIVAVALAFTTFSVLTLNPTGLGLASVGFVATVASGLLFFKNYDAKTTTLDSYLQNQPNTKI